VKVLVACEFSGVVREAFRALGHDAWSCDLLPTEIPGQHITGDVLKRLADGWDLMIAHPPCTHLAVSGARWFSGKLHEQPLALEFVRLLLSAPIARIALENPIGKIVQPWQFGHGETKATCFWLKGLNPLTPTNIVSGRLAKCHRRPPGKDRWKERSRTHTGIAQAMAEQWGGQP
jgi:site-specific DNA-cytosine methylase